MKLNQLFALALAVVAVTSLTVSHLSAAEQTQELHHDSEHSHLNTLGVFLGNTYEDGDHGSENGFSFGLNYERRFSKFLGVGGFYEYAAGDFDKWSVGVPLFIHPYREFRFVLAPGLEHRHGDDEFLFRIGVGYEFQLKERWIISPEFNVDFVDGEDAQVFGISFGIGF
jgi:hypothetical protein